MSDNLMISVEIADRIYKVTVKRDEEEIFRKAVETVKLDIKEYAKKFAYKDNQDLLAMVLLQYVTSFMKTQEDSFFNDKTLVAKLKEIDSILKEEK
jgi:cell division protein ZapA